MVFKPLHLMASESILPVLRGIPFYRSVSEQDEQQFDCLLKHSQVGTFGPDEIVLSEGEQDSWVFFLLRGQLDVYSGSDKTLPAINQITPGEVFGDLSMLTGGQRIATIRACKHARQTTVLGLDFRLFGALEDFSRLSLKTKLAYYRNTAHNLRWKLDVYRLEYPDSGLSAKHRSLKPFIGIRDSVEELRALEHQAKSFAKWLGAWNQKLSTPMSAPKGPAVLAAQQSA
jgi:hypothetical protein